jgi:hypothetical protein
MCSYVGAYNYVITTCTTQNKNTLNDTPHPNKKTQLSCNKLQEFEPRKHKAKLNKNLHNGKKTIIIKFM